MEDKKFNKEGLLKAVAAVDTQTLINAIKEGTVSMQDLIQHGLTAVRAKKISDELNKHEEAVWTAVKKKVEANDKDWNVKVDALNNYEKQYPNGKYINNVRDLMTYVDNRCWDNALLKSDVSEQESCLKEYETLFHEGEHIIACKEMQDDLPWAKTKQANTIQAYESYSKNYPAKHQEEIQQAIINLTDDEDWNSAQQTNTEEAYNEYKQKHPKGKYYATADSLSDKLGWQKAQAQKTNITQACIDYLEKHPNGKHVQDAQDIIKERTATDKLLADLKKDKNSKSAVEIQDAVKNNTITYEDLEAIVGKDIVDVLKEFKNAITLNLAMALNDKLQDKTTEVYLWGMTNSGKTCVLGSILANGHKNGILFPLNCKDTVYMNTLINIFKPDICVLPASTDVDTIAEMMVKIEKHNLSLIDIPGALFQNVYDALNRNIPPNNTLQTLISYLNDTRNDKIHFFIIEYSLNNKIRTINGISADFYLATMLQYLNDKGVLGEKTTCLSVIVTKCDLIEEDNKYGEVARFLNTNYMAFMKQLKEIAKDNRIGGVNTFAFSIGDVYFQNICRVNYADTQKIIDKMKEKSRKTSTGGFFNWLFD